MNLEFINFSARDRCYRSKIINKALDIVNFEHVEKSQPPVVKQMSKPGPKQREFANDKAANEWLNSFKASTRNTYRDHWGRFLDYMGMTGDRILESRRADKKYNWEKRILAYKEWLKIQKNEKGELLSDYYVRQSTITVRSFFAFHRVDLQFRHAEKTKLREAKPKTTDYRFSREDLKRMTDIADLEGKYVVVVGKSFGLRAGDFLALTRGHFDPYIDRQPPVSVGKIYTTKEKVPAFPFVDTDAKPIIKAMLDNLTRLVLLSWSASQDFE